MIEFGHINLKRISYYEKEGREDFTLLGAAGVDTVEDEVAG